MTENQKTWMGIGAFAAVLSLAGWYLFAPGAQGLAERADQRVSGVVEGTEVDLAFKMGGTIKDVYVKEGDAVKPGQLLAELTSDELKAKREQAAAAYELAKVKLQQAQKGVAVTDGTSAAQVEQARAAVEAAKAQYEALKNGARPEEIAQLEAKLQAAATAKETARLNLQRTQDLFRQGAVPQAKVEEAQVQYDKAAAEWSATQEQLKMAKSGARREQLDAARAQWEQARAAYEQAVAGQGQVGLRQLDVGAAQAGVEQAKGALDEVDAALANTKLTSPVAGVVKSVSVQKGELVAQGFTVVTIQVQEEQFVKFYVDEDKLGDVKAGDKETLYVPALGKHVTGTVQMVAPAADFAVKKATQELADRDIRSFLVKLDVSKQGLRPGLTVEWQTGGEGARE